MSLQIATLLLLNLGTAFVLFTIFFLLRLYLLPHFLANQTYNSLLLLLLLIYILVFKSLMCMFFSQFSFVFMISSNTPWYSYYILSVYYFFLFFICACSALLVLTAKNFCFTLLLTLAYNSQGYILTLLILQRSLYLFKKFMFLYYKELP